MDKSSAEMNLAVKLMESSCLMKKCYVSDDWGWVV